MAIVKKKSGFTLAQKIDFSYSEAVFYMNTLPRSLVRTGMLDTIDGHPGMVAKKMPHVNFYQSKDKYFFALEAVEI
jgi:hypothetical protein